MENWLLGVGVSALVVAGASLFLLSARDPARTVGLAILAIAGATVVICAVGWILIEVKEGRVVNRIGDADVIALMDKQRWDEAIAKLEIRQASQDEATRDQAWNRLAQCYAATGRNAEAEAMIRRSIDARGESNENLGEQLSCLGAVVRRQGRSKEAEEIYGRALDLLRSRDPEATVFALRNVAYLNWLEGKKEMALHIYDQMPECDIDQLEFLIELLEPLSEPPLPVEAPNAG
ncbi:MAG TPA: tetratricopeptide repeat protein [Candidatus Dormibacteraeota bacterium]|nr:tetratricopeptide repeat protein [Candidatus Dormibacteraeota bacterium]